MEPKPGDFFINDDGDELRIDAIIEDTEGGGYRIRAEDGIVYHIILAGDEFVEDKE